MSKKKKEILAIITCIAFLLAGIFIGYFYSQNRKNSSESQIEKEDALDKKDDQTSKEILNRVVGEWGTCSGDNTCYGINITKEKEEEYYYEPYVMWSESTGSGKITSVEKVNEQKYIFTVHYDAVDGIEMSREESTVETVVNTSKIEEGILIISGTEYQKIEGDRDQKYQEILKGTK